jgi:hypothetical protein
LDVQHIRGSNERTPEDHPQIYRCSPNGRAIGPTSNGDKGAKIETMEIRVPKLKRPHFTLFWALVGHQRSSTGLSKKSARKKKKRDE